MEFGQVGRLFQHINRELWVVTSAFGTRCGGLLASFVSPISIVPTLPRLGVAISKQHHTWSLVEQSRAFAVHLLSEQQLELAWHFGTFSGHHVDKFENLQFTMGVIGSPVLSVCPAYLECRVESSLDTGDRTFYLAEVIDGQFPDSEFVPLTQAELIRKANSEQLLRLRTQLANDSQIDEAAILNWRARN